MTRAAIYRRVSTQKQSHEDKFSLSEQNDKCTKHCTSKGYEVIANLEDVYSGAELDQRPKMSELRELMRKQKIHVIVATNLDRISRSRIHQTVVLYEAEQYDVRLELTEETFEETGAGCMMRMFSGFYAEIEHEKVRDRTLRGKLQRAREGLMIPGSSPLYGYSWADERKTHYVINPATAPVAIRIWNEAASGKAIRRIAIDLTNEGIDCPKDAWRREKGDPNDPPQGAAWAFNTVRTMLHNPAYWGEHSAFRWDTTGRRRDIDPITGEVTKRHVWKERGEGDGRYALPAGAPALVTPELARIIHERMARNREEVARYNKHPEVGLLRAGFIKCGICGRNMIFAQKSDGAFVYKCSARNRSVSDTSCPNKSALGVKTTDADVWERLMAVLQDPEYVEKEMMPPS